jgi:hypothetical protein
MSISPDDYRDSSNFNTSIYLPLMIGLIGAVIGVIGIVLALRAQSAAEQASVALGSRDQLAAELKTFVQDLEGRVTALTVRVQQQESAGARIPDQVRAAINSLGQRQDQAEMNMNLVGNRLREIGPQIEELDRRTKELAMSRTSGGRSSAASTGGVDATSAGTESSGSGSGGVYTVKAGDALISIAKRHKVSLNDLMQANPGVDPQRLQIGQEIRIP